MCYNKIIDHDSLLDEKLILFFENSSEHIIDNMFDYKQYIQKEMMGILDDYENKKDNKANEIKI